MCGSKNNAGVFMGNVFSTSSVLFLTSLRAFLSFPIFISPIKKVNCSTRIIHSHSVVALGPFTNPSVVLYAAKLRAPVYLLFDLFS